MRKEPYELRLEMAQMHDVFIERLNEAMTSKQYVEASWLCYAIFEQRISRIIGKHIAKCPKGKRPENSNPVSISTKITCLKKLSKHQYGAYSNFDKKLLDDISKWCKKRNLLIHGLVSLEHYKKYDSEFELLAKTGMPLVERLYKQATEVREWCNENQFGKFPAIKCKCNYKCLYENK